MAKKRKKYTFEELWNPQIDLRFDAAAYARQSTKDQVIENVQSHISQTVGILLETKSLGYKDDGSTGKVVLFVENQVVDEDGNTQIKNASGTWPIDKRPDLKAILDLIEEDKIKLVIVEFVDRLFRDEDRIDSNIFIKACKEHNCLVYVTSKKMLYNLNNPQMAEMFRMEVAFAAAYIEHHVRGTMLRRRDQAVAAGKFGGGFVPMGFIVCKEKGKDYNKLIQYPPHAKILKETGIEVVRLGIAEVCRQAQETPIFFPDFEEGVEAGHRALDKVDGGYVLRTRCGLISTLTNPANIGDIVYGENIKVPGAHDAIFDKDFYSLLLAKLKGDKSNKVRRYYQGDSGTERVGTLKKLLAIEGLNSCVYSKTKGLYHYKCYNQGMIEKDLMCLGADFIESLIENRLLERIRICDLGSFENEIKERKAKKIKDLADMDRRIVAIDEELDNLTDSLVKTKIQSTIDRINKRSAKLELDRIELCENRKVLAVELAEEDLSVESELSGLNIMKRPARIRQALLEHLAKRVVVKQHSPKYLSVRIEWKESIGWGVDEIYVDRGNSWSVHWTHEEVSILEALYPTTLNIEEILKALPNRSWRSICTKAAQKKIKRLYRPKGGATIPDTYSWNDQQFLDSAKNIVVGKWVNFA
jgi:DNA invertase Pin-like site-specific DNA recombinase